MTQSVSPVRRLRLMLVLSSAMGTTTLGGLAATPAWGQSIPTRADVAQTQQSSQIGKPDISNPGGNLKVVLNSRSTVIDWNGFNIPEDKTANFQKGDFVSGNAAVLNRDVSGNASQLLGKLTSDPGVAVWVYNPNGILVGSKASFNTGSLVLSTLDVNSSDFLAGGSNYRLSAASGSTSAITVLNGAQIKVDGGNRGLVMVAPKIDAQGSFQAGSQDVAFVTATDVTLSYSASSPLSVTINRGTAVSGRSQYVRGSVGGRDALFALASQATVTDALLQVDADVTTATMGTRGIVLSAGKAANAVDGVTVGGATADIGGVANLVTNGALTVNDQDGSDILAGASGSALFAGALSSQRDVALSSDGALTVAGAVTADRDYLLSGTGVALGNGTTLGQQAGRAVRIVSRNGNLTGAANLTLGSGGSAGISLSTTGTAAGDVLFDPSSRLAGGDNRQGYVDIVRRDAGNGVALGNVTGRALRQGIGNGAVANGLTTGGALVLGDVNVRDALSLNVSGLTAGALASDNGVTIVSNGAVTAGSILARNGAVSLTGSGATTITGAAAANGGSNDLTITRDGAVSVQGLSATHDVRIDAGGGTAAIAGAVTAGMQYRVSASGVTLGGSLPVTQSANDGVTITAGAGGITGASGLTLQSNADGFGGDGLTLALTAASTTGIAFAANTSLLGGTTGQSDIAVQLADGASPIALGRIQARNLTGLDTGGALRVGAVSVAGDLVVRGATVESGALSSSRGRVALTATSGVLSAGTVNAANGIAVTGAQAVTVGGLSAGDAIALTGQGAVAIGGDVAAGGAVTLQGASLGLAGGRLASGGAIDLRATGGGIASTGALAISSTSRQSSDFIRLQAAGADGIVLAPGSAITAGRNQALRVGIFNGSADAPLKLGDVTARSLTALAAAGGDATQPGGAIVSNGSLAFGTLSLIDGFAAESVNGDLTVNQLAVTGNGQGISLRATKGTLNVQNNVSTDGDVTLASGTALTLGTVASRSGRATLTSGGAVTLSNLSGALGTSASGTQLAIDTVQGGAVTLTASAGGIQVGGIAGTSVSAIASGGDVAIRNAVNASAAVSLTASGNVGVGGGLTGAGVTIGAQGDAVLLGGMQAQGDVTVSGRSVTLGGVNRATGRYGVTATGGGITGGTGTTILSDSDGQGGEGLSLTATGNIAFDPTSSLGGGTGTAAVTLTSGGGTIGVGDVTATNLAVSGAGTIRTGRLALGTGLSLAAAGGVSTGAIAVGSGGVAIDAGSGALSTGAIDANSGAVTLSGGTLSFGPVGATALSATATGGLTGGAITTRGDSVLRGSAITVGDVAAANLSAVTTSGALGLGNLTIGGTATLSGGDIGFGRVNAASLSATATGALRGGDLATSGVASLTAGGALNLGQANAGGAATLRGATIAIGNVDAASLSATATSGALVAGDVTTGDAATITAGQGGIDLGTVTTARGDVTIAAGGRLNAAGITSGGAATLGASSANADILLANGLDAVGSASVSATGNVRAPSIRSRTGDLTIAAPNGELTGYRPGTGVALGAGPGRAFSLTIGTAARLGDVVGGKLTVVATSISTGRVDTGTEALQLRATAGDLTVSGPVSGGTVTLGASGRTSLGDVTATGPLTLTGGTVGFGTIAGPSIAVTAAGAINGGTIRATGAATVSGSAITLDQVSGGTVGLAATAGDLALTGPVTGSDVTLSASGRAALGQVTATGGLAITGGNVGFGDLAGASVNVGSTGMVNGNSVRAASAAVVSGSAITLNQVSGGTVGLTATDGDLALTGPVTGSDVTLSASGRAALRQVAATGALAITGGNVGFGDLAGASVNVGSTGMVNGNSVRATSAAVVSGSAITLNQVSGGTVGLTATGGDLALTGPVTGSDVTLSASGRAALGQVTATGGLAITGGNVGFGDLAGASVNVGSTGMVDGNSVRATSAATVTGSAITLNQVSGGTVGLTATAGDLALTGPVTGSDVTLSASGRAALGQVTASGGLRMRAASIGFDAITGASVDGQSGGTIAGNAVRAGGALALRGSSVTLDRAVAGTGLNLAAGTGDLIVNTLSAGGDVVLTAGGAARIAGAVTSGGSYRVTGGSVALGGAEGIVQTAAADVRVTATSGDVTAARGLTLVSDADGVGGEALVLDAAGQIGFAGTRLQARPGGGAALGLRAGSGRTIELGSVEASRIGRFDGSAVATGLTHDASLTTGDLTVGDLSIGLSRGDLSLGRVTATGAAALRTDSGKMALGDLRAANVDLASGGALTSGAVSSGGAVSLTGERIDVGGRLSAARQLLARARAALTLRDVGAGGAVTLQAGDALSAGAVEGASITASGAGLAMAGAKAGDTLALTSSRDLTLTGGSAGGVATLDVAGLATIGALSAGPSATITAGDVALGGPLRAQAVAFVNRASGTATLRIGDGAGDDGFRLSDAEVRQVSADTLRFDAGSGAMEVGTLTLGTASGRAVDMLGTGDVRVTGRVSTQGTGRSVRIGGGADSGNAASIQVVATRDGGGRLLFDGSDVDLRGNRIAVGLARGFIETLQPGTAGLAQAQSLIGNGNSALYNPQLGGGFYDPAATTTLSARSLSVRFGDYALFQNTAVPGEFSGLTLGGTPGAPVSPALRISSFGTPGQNGVALFGTINGISGASAALLGNPVIAIDPSLLPTSRINGCLVGSGAGCITTIVIQPTLQVFNWNSEEVFGISRDVAVPFSPVIGANNEELLSDLPALAPESPQDRKGEQ